FNEPPTSAICTPSLHDALPISSWRGLARLLRRLAPSHIVNITSVAARTGSPGEHVAYAATKAALNALTVGLARELAPQRIHVNADRKSTRLNSSHVKTSYAVFC